MKVLDNLFNNTKMTWKRTILFAVIAGIYTGLIMLPEFLEGTSFQDIGIFVEVWVLFAVIIVVNCEKPVEAALKCFVFFLISQPVVYLVQIALGDLTFNLAKTYYFSTWLPMTIATLPGGFVAYYCKKQTVFGSIVMGLGSAIVLFMGAHYLYNILLPGRPCVLGFIPCHSLSLLYCLSCPIVMTYFLQKRKKGRVISYALAGILVIGAFSFALSRGLTL